jgi:glycosyltransferase involved in cell wall biosynthesis
MRKITIGKNTPVIRQGGRNMKVVIPVEELHIGGGCKVIVDLSDTLTMRGHEVEIVILESGVVQYPISCKLTRVYGLLKETIPYGDIILPNFYTTFAPAFEAWPAQCVRLSLGFEPYWVADREKALWTYKQQIPIISISRWLDHQIYEHAGMRSTIVSLGVDPAVFYPTPKSIEANQPKIILYIARDPEEGYKLKGFDDFRKCMDIVNHEWPGDFIVYLICPGRKLSLPGIPHRHFFPKDEEEMAALYRAADVFVSSSWFEAFSLPPLEAMACGTPVVTTNSGGVLDFAAHMESAYITPPKDPRSLAQGICAVLTDKELVKMLVLGGVQSAKRLNKEQANWKMVSALERIYQERSYI